MALRTGVSSPADYTSPPAGKCETSESSHPLPLFQALHVKPIFDLMVKFKACVVLNILAMSSRSMLLKYRTCLEQFHTLELMHLTATAEHTGHTAAGISVGFQGSHKFQQSPKHKGNARLRCKDWKKQVVLVSRWHIIQGNEVYKRHWHRRLSFQYSVHRTMDHKT